MYPLFPFLRDWVAGRCPSPNRRFALAWTAGAAGIAAALGVLAFLGWQGRETPAHGRNGIAYDQAYMRRMASHHAQGAELARLAADRAQNPHLRALARQIAAAQQGEIAVFAQWWLSWFGGPLPPPAPQEHATMPGMLSPDEMDSAREASGASFDARFVELMSEHHRGAIAMAQDAAERAGDIRLRIMSHGIAFSQHGEIELMHGVEGVPAVRSAVRVLLFGAQAGRGATRSVSQEHEHR
jgi:uncharacterized protein (DUF305 family)